MMDSAAVTYRLSHAGRTLLALPAGQARIRDGAWAMLWMDAASLRLPPMRPPPPTARDVAQMGEALAWLAALAGFRWVLTRQIVAARCLVSPVTERNLFSWNRIGTIVGLDPKTVSLKHAQGVDAIVASLRTQERLAA